MVHAHRLLEAGGLVVDVDVDVAELGRPEPHDALAHVDLPVPVHVVGHEEGLAEGRDGVVEAGGGAVVALLVAVGVEVEPVDRGVEAAGPRRHRRSRLVGVGLGRDDLHLLARIDLAVPVQVDGVDAGREHAVAVDVDPVVVARVPAEEGGVEDVDQRVDVPDDHALPRHQVERRSGAARVREADELRGVVERERPARRDDRDARDLGPRDEGERGGGVDAGGDEAVVGDDLPVHLGEDRAGLPEDGEGGRRDGGRGAPSSPARGRGAAGRGGRRRSGPSGWRGPPAD